METDLSRAQRRKAAEDLCKFGEDEACKLLKKNGCKILERNYRVICGEIDVIARSRNTIIFVEVKARTSSAFAEPWEAVAFRKRKRLKAAARIFIHERPIKDVEFRFDVISITLDESLRPKTEWIQNAF